MKFFQYAGLLSAAFLGGFIANVAFDAGTANAEDPKTKPAKSKEKATDADPKEVLLKGKDGKTRARLGFDKAGNPNLFLTASNGVEFAQFGNIERNLEHKTKVKPFREEIEALKDRKELSDNKITVSHILISFKGRGTNATRSKNEAEILAMEVLAKIKKGEDFETLKKAHSNDGPGGTYTMLLKGTPDRAKKIFLRSGMVAAFGNVGWRLPKVGDVGVAGFDATTSPYGWHIVKRVANPE